MKPGAMNLHSLARAAIFDMDGVIFGTRLSQVKTW
jgi:beta-phosphoglucomutase-like phosphatase (HAD superfamily)